MTPLLTPFTAAGQKVCSPLLPGLLLRGFHGTLQGALEGLKLVQCFLQKKASHKLLQIRSFLIVLKVTRETKKVRICLLGWKYVREEDSDLIEKGSSLDVFMLKHTNCINNL